MEKYHMQKVEREIHDREVIETILKDGKFLILALSRDGNPYLVTLNYGYDEKNKAMYFHSALKGMKIDYIKSNSKACATVIEDQGYKMDECEHAYKSAVIFGKISIVEDIKEKMYGMDVMLNHLEDSPDAVRTRLLKNEKAYEKMSIIKLKIESVTGKEGK